MRVAYIALKGMPRGGGIEKLTEEIGARLVRKGHEVLIYSSRDYATEDGEYRGMRIKTVPSINRRSFHKLSICLAATVDVLCNEKVDLVHVHALGPSLFSIFPRLKGIPAVVQAHGLEWKRDKWGIIAKTFFRLSDLTAVYFPNRLTAVSKVQKKYFEQRYGREVVYIPTGVNCMNKREPRWLLQLDLKPQRYILFAARLVEEKGAHFLIDAYKHLGKTDFKLVIAGDAANEWRYKDLLLEISERDPRIVMTGFVMGEPLEELFSNAYVFCLPSTIEGLPIALLEAMSYGNCCVASDIPENLEAMGGNGYTFKSRDSKDLHEVLRRLLDNPGLVEEKKAAAQKYVLSNYSWDKVADDMEQLYLSLVRTGNNGHA